MPSTIYKIQSLMVTVDGQKISLTGAGQSNLLDKNELKYIDHDTLWEYNKTWGGACFMLPELPFVSQVLLEVFIWRQTRQCYDLASCQWFCLEFLQGNRQLQLKVLWEKYNKKIHEARKCFKRVF